MKEIIYPIRINKYLAYKNITTRREADDFIKKGLVKINNKQASLGDMVDENDNVNVDESFLEKREFSYLVFNKPKGIVTHSPQKGEKGILDIIDFSKKVFPVGRLDKDSSGLIILTDDGRIIDRLLNPDFYHEKEYVVVVNREMSPSFLKHMAEGVQLDDGYLTRKCQIKKMNNFKFSIILTEGKKRQIRRMCERLDRRVMELERVRLINIHLGELRPGQYRKMKFQEKKAFLSEIGIN